MFTLACGKLRIQGDNVQWNPYLYVLKHSRGSQLNRKASKYKGSIMHTFHSETIQHMHCVDHVTRIL